jgi:Tol biopolymer transport system component
MPNMNILAILLCLALPLAAQRISGTQLDNLPSNMEVLTHFGERADISPDSKQVAFMAKSFGDAMTIDLETRTIRCLTCNVPGAAFLRVMHLRSGDYLLIGPDHFEDIRISRSRDNELWFLSKERGSKPRKLGRRMSEGAAISKTGNKIAFALKHDQEPSLPVGASQIVVAEIRTSGGIAELVNQKVVFQSPDETCVVEPQDFYDSDRKLTFSCYEKGPGTSVMSLDLGSGEATNHSRKPGAYNEVEGIIPGTEYTLVEADRQCETLGGQRGSGNIDIWRLKLDGTGTDFERITYFNDYEYGKASNPVVSIDGRLMAFQSAKTTDPAGVGYGILLYWFRR